HVIDALEVARLLDRHHVLRLLDDANQVAIAGVAAAEDARVGVGDVVADGTIGDALLHLAHGVHEAVGLFARRLENVKREPLRALGTDAGQALQLLDEADEGLGQAHRPGIFSPPIMPPIFCDISSSALRCASLIAATIRSCSISTSSFDTTSASIFSDSICLAPLTTTVTIPPPALPSTRSSVICFCRCSCICCACFIICWMFIISALSCQLHLFD